MYNKFKDKMPEDTIEFIRKVLLNWGILVTEKWYDDLEDLCSLRLTIDGTDFSTYGKGTGKIYALASAYGEMIERLQNLAFFRLVGTSAITDNVEVNDNTYVVLHDHDGIFEKNIITWIGKISGKKISDKLIGKMKSYCSERGHIRYYIFEELTSKKKIEIPEKILDIYYGTNGMVSGNNFYEALVQGLSEILERYVNVEILRGEVSPPDITDYIKEIMPEAKQWIKEIENQGGKIVEIKDMSLGKQIPAVGVIMYNRWEAGYFIKIAVHPIVEIAVERCFTELLQGQKISEYYGMTNANIFSKDTFNRKNLSEILIYGSGIYPISIFTGSPSYEYFSVKREYSSNEEMMIELKTLIERLGYEIYITNPNYSEFETYHIIVPGMSEIELEEDSIIIERGINYDKFCKIIQYRLKKITDNEITFVLDYMEKYNISQTRRIKDFLYDIRVTSNCVYGMVTIDLFKCLLYLKKKDYKSALLWLSAYNKNLDRNCLESKYYLGYELLLQLLVLGIDMQKSTIYMKKFYDEAIVHMVINDFSQNPFEYFEPIICEGRCMSCVHEKYCITKTERKIYHKIKKTSFDK